ncbi:MAG TPA: hypothetical protein VKZ63_07005 [Kofleriaceae bacterium]|nr:hypothetical protein [Kofleriaceae bacterium]
MRRFAPPPSTHPCSNAENQLQQPQHKPKQPVGDVVVRWGL